MAIDYCKRHETQWDRDEHTECPWCESVANWLQLSRNAPGQERATMTIKAPIQINDEPTALVRILKDETNSRDVFERCKRVLGEA